MSLVPAERRRTAVTTVLAAALLGVVVGYLRIGSVGGAVGFGLVVAAGAGVGLLGYEAVQRAL